MDAFEIDVASHFKDVTHLCSDANNIYSKFCNNKNIIHYVRPSNYLERIKNGRKAGKTDNDMYNNQEIDYIEGRNLSYAQFKYMKDKYKLSLAHVNQVHSHLKQKLVYEKHGITLKNIDGYVCWETIIEFHPLIIKTSFQIISSYFTSFQKVLDIFKTSNEITSLF